MAKFQHSLIKPQKGLFSHIDHNTHTTLQHIIKSSELSSKSHTPKTRQNRPKTAKNSVFRPQNRQNDGSPSGAKFSGPDPQKSSFFNFFTTLSTLHQHHQRFTHSMHTQHSQPTPKKVRKNWPWHTNPRPALQPSHTAHRVRTPTWFTAATSYDNFPS